MIRLGSRRHSRFALLFRRFYTSKDLARRRDAIDTRVVDQFASRDAGSVYRDRPTELATSSTAAQRAAQPTSATDRRRRNPHSV